MAEPIRTTTSVLLLSDTKARNFRLLSLPASLCQSAMPCHHPLGWQMADADGTWSGQATAGYPEPPQKPDGGEFFDQLVMSEERSASGRAQTTRTQGMVVQHDQLMGQSDPVRLRVPCGRHGPSDLPQISL